MADIFILPSVNETWGLVINEAMSQGCAIITTAEVGSAADLVEQDVNGYILPEVSLQSLKKALYDITRSGRCEAIGQQSLKIIATWTPEESVRPFLMELLHD